MVSERAGFLGSAVYRAGNQCREFLDGAGLGAVVGAGRRHRQAASAYPDAANQSFDVRNLHLHHQRFFALVARRNRAGFCGLRFLDGGTRRHRAFGDSYADALGIAKERALIPDLKTRSGVRVWIVYETDYYFASQERVRAEQHRPFFRNDGDECTQLRLSFLSGSHREC